MKYRTASYAEGVWDNYWYEKNIFGDVVAVYNNAGTKLVTYTYDAWGAIYSQTYLNGGAGTAAQYNPFRYRSYYYDASLGFYYLNARYYDPMNGRFISPDSYVSTGQGILGHNMYAYCNNNPVMFVDPTGEVPWLILGFLALTTITGGFLGTLYTSNIKEQTKNTDILPEIDNDDNSEKLDHFERYDAFSAKEYAKNIIIGGALGLAAGGAIISTGGVIVGAIGGIGATYLGVTALQGFAIGALAFDFSALIILPLFSIQINPIEYETPTAPNLP